MAYYIKSSAMVPVLLLAVLAIAPVLAIATTSAINATCTALDAQHYDHPYAYCVGVLSGDSAAAAATDERGVAAAAINIAAHKAAATVSVVTYLVDELSLCSKYYGRMVESLTAVLADFHAGRFDDAALAKARSASEVPNDCDVILLQGSAKKNPFSQENIDNGRLSGLARDITALVANKGPS
ncbi:hypothetical protein SORBI_3004G277700, partial [Sorghum bicolor]